MCEYKRHPPYKVTAVKLCIIHRPYMGPIVVHEGEVIPLCPSVINHDILSIFTGFPTMLLRPGITRDHQSVTISAELYLVRVSAMRITSVVVI